MTAVKIRRLGDRVSRCAASGLAVANGGANLRDAEYPAVARLPADAPVGGDPPLAARHAGRRGGRPLGSEGVRVSRAR